MSGYIVREHNCLNGTHCPSKYGSLVPVHMSTQVELGGRRGQERATELRRPN